MGGSDLFGFFRILSLCFLIFLVRGCRESYIDWVFIGLNGIGVLCLHTSKSPFFFRMFSSFTFSMLAKSCQTRLTHFFFDGWESQVLYAVDV